MEKNKNSSFTIYHSQLKMIPELRFPEFKNSGEWEIDKFSNFIKLYRGSSPRPINQFLTKKENGVNWIKIGDTQNAKNYKISKTKEKITIEGSKKSRKVIRGELILANSMSYGATYELQIDGCIYDGWFVLRDYENSFDKLFLLQLLNSNILQIQYKRLAAGGIVKNISSDIVYNTLLPKPSKQEQQKIASFLSNLDELIDAHKQKLALLKQHKKGLLQNLFPSENDELSMVNGELSMVNGELSMVNGELSMVNGELKNVPKLRFPEFQNDGEWVEKKLLQVAHYENGKAHEKNIDENGQYIVVNSKYISSDGETVKYSNEAFCLAQKGDILMVLSDVPNGKAIAKCFYVKENNKYTVNQRICRISPFDSDNKFLFYILNRNKYFLAFDDGVKQTNLSKDNVLNTPLLLPITIKEQQKIADFLSNLDELITTQADKIEQLEGHKKGLMQRVFPNYEL